jgi:ATP-dependent exoDNAse (exonuclease V) alpha subunit
MVSSAQLAELCRLAAAASAKVVAVGDYRQLGAVDAGGLFQLLACDTDAAELMGAWRFHQPWERDATLDLRHGRTTTADIYHQHGRLIAGDGEVTLDAMVQRWAELNDTTDGSVVMLASRRDDVTALAHLARRHLIAAGQVEPDGIGIDGQMVGLGDRIWTLRNDRRLLTDRGRWVRNGDRHPT